MRVIRNKYVTTRKDHKCFGCHRVLKTGTCMFYCAGTDGGEWWWYHLCKACKAFLDDNPDILELDDVIYEGFLLEEDFEVRNEYFLRYC